MRVPRLIRDARNGKLVREYVSHELSPELDKTVAKLMQIVFYNHERQKLKYMIGANDTEMKKKKKKKKRKKRVKREPRMLLGFREVKRSAHHGELECVVIAPDLEVSRNKDGLDDTVNDIVESCNRHAIPVFFAM